MQNLVLLRKIRLEKQKLVEEQRKRRQKELTKSEKQVVRLIAADLYTKEIADRLHVTDGAISFHRQNIKAKLHCKTSGGIVYNAIRAGYLKVELPENNR